MQAARIHHDIAGSNWRLGERANCLVPFHVTHSLSWNMSSLMGGKVPYFLSWHTTRIYLLLDSQGNYSFHQRVGSCWTGFCFSVCRTATGEQREIFTSVESSFAASVIWWHRFSPQPLSKLGRRWHFFSYCVAPALWTYSRVRLIAPTVVVVSEIKNEFPYYSYAVNPLLHS